MAPRDATDTSFPWLPTNHAGRAITARAERQRGRWAQAACGSA
jgi:hypothetical protein